MTEIPSPPLYRLFQKVALGVGVVVFIAGFAMQNSAVLGAGLVIFLHALIATIIIIVEDRRSPTKSDEWNPRRPDGRSFADADTQLQRG